jgi:hypothetical protein
MGSIIHESEEINNMVLTNKSINIVDDKVYYCTLNKLYKQVYYQVNYQVRCKMWDQLFMNLRK